MQCPRCLNTDPSYFYKGSKGWYCRRCISFSRVLLTEEQEPVALEEVHAAAEEYELIYPLTDKQAELSRQCVQLAESTDILIKAVCGAGKTEIVVPVIASMLKKKRKVCFAIARRQVVLELAGRLQKIFPKAAVIPVCQGYTERLSGDLVICTTHQLYRYYQAFDLLILDEPDAFPFRGNEVLHGIADTACRGHRIYLTATPDRILLRQVSRKKMVMLELNVRPHGHPLPVPEEKTGFALLRLYWLVRWLRAHADHPCLVFVPTIRLAKQIGLFLGVLFDCSVCTSQTPDRDRVIEAFRQKAAGVMVATTVLERGVTIPGVDICVYNADHRVFDEAGLVQMAGRAGRTFRQPDGDVLFLLRETSDTADRCVDEIRRANQCAA
jgi:competence protein ComFA